MANDENLTLEDAIGADPGTIAEEMMSPDERDAAQERASDSEPEQSESGEGAETEAPDTETATTAGVDADEDDGDELPAFMTPEYLEKHPKDAENWRALKEQRNDFRSGLKQAQEFMSSRDAEVKTLHAELAAIKAAQAQAARAPAAPPADPIENPEEFRAQVEQRVSNEVAAVRFDMSEQLATTKHGQEKVDEAFARYEKAIASDPTLGQMIQNSPDPWGTMIAEMDRRALLSEMGNDPAAYRNRLESEALEKARAQVTAELEAGKAEAVERALEQRRSIPSSIATAPGSGRDASAGMQWNGPEPLSAALGSALDN